MGKKIQEVFYCSLVIFKTVLCSSVLSLSFISQVVGESTVFLLLEAGQSGDSGPILFVRRLGLELEFASLALPKKLEGQLPFQLGRDTPPWPQWLRCPFPLISFQRFLSSLSFGDTLCKHEGSRMSFCLSSKHSPVVAILRFPSTSHMFEGLLHCD